jgi:predicted Zn-dependent protease
MKSIKFIFLLSLLLLSHLSTFGQDKMLQILKKELVENYKKLETREYPPYFISFRVADVTIVNISANLGSLTENSRQHNIWFVPQIRVGSEQFDNFHDLQNGAPSDFQNPPAPVYLPLNYTESEDVLREIIGNEVESRYKFASAAIENSRARAASTTGSRDTTGDYTKAGSERYYDEPYNEGKLFPEETISAWREKIKRLSSLFNSNPDVFNAAVALNCEFRRKYYVSTDSSSIVENQPYLILSIHAAGIAQDGMTLPLHKTYFAFDFNELPADSVIIKDIRAISSKISELVKAPLVQAYNGPALLSGGAAGVFFHEIFGHRIEGQRLKNDMDGQTFKYMTGKEVLLKELNIKDDPTAKYYNGTPLYGHFKFDDQGVRGELTDVVNGGILKNFLMTRTPINGHLKSNGHARADFVNDPTSRQSNLIIESGHNYSDEQMKQMLREEIVKAKKEYGYYFKEVTGGFTQISSVSVNSFNVLPLEVYRVYADGREDELVRGVDLIGTPLAMFSNIICAGGKYEVFTGLCGASSGNIPVTAISPSILVNNVELQSKPKTPATPPLLMRDTTNNRKESCSSGTENDMSVFNAMESELRRSEKELKMPNSSSPSYILYTLVENRNAYATAVKGAVISSGYIPARRYSSVNLYVGDKNFSSDYSYSGSGLISPVQVSLENDEAAIKRAFWYNTDVAYKFALDVFTAKKNKMKSLNMTEEEKNLPDMLPLTDTIRVGSFPKIQPYTDESEKRCSDLARELSLIFSKYPVLLSSKVNVNEMQSIYYISGNEGTRIRVPVSITYINLSASVKQKDGNIIGDFENIAANTFQELPSIEELRVKVENFASKLSSLEKAEKFGEYYYGPLLFEDNAVSAIFLSNFAGEDGIYAYRKPVQVASSVASTEDVSGRLQLVPLEKRVGERIVDPLLNIYNRTDLKDFTGNKLIGAYSLDVQGVRPVKNLQLIKEGRLERVLSNRVPTLTSKESTGSMRAGIRGNSMAISLAPGILVIEAREGSTPARLKKELIKRAKEQGLKYAYIVRKLSNRENQVLYRVSVKDGSETPVTGAAISPVTMSKLNKIGPKGISTEQTFENTMFQGTVPMSVIFPRSLLINEMEIRM